MACFCGCETFEKHTDGKIVGCVKCNHGRQNHDDEWREAARKNEQQSQKRDTDFWITISSNFYLNSQAQNSRSLSSYQRIFCIIACNWIQNG